MDSEHWWIKECEFDLEQGDIIKDVPFLLPAASPVYLERFSGRDGVAWRELTEAKIDGDGKTVALSKGPYMSAVVLNHGCDIEKKQNKYVGLALVRDISDFQEADKDRIIRRETVPQLYLPSVPGLGDSVVDLRMTTLLPTAFVKTLVRCASMSEAGRVALQAQLFAFYTRRDPAELLGTKPVTS